MGENYWIKAESKQVTFKFSFKISSGHKLEHKSDYWLCNVCF